MPKDWNAIVRDLSSPESSDAEDDLNVLSVQKNASRVAELVQGLVPGLDATQMRDAPYGMNRPDVMRDALAATIAGMSRRSVARPPPAPTTTPRDASAAAGSEGSDAEEGSAEASAGDGLSEAHPSTVGAVVARRAVEAALKAAEQRPSWEAFECAQSTHTPA